MFLQLVALWILALRFTVAVFDDEAFEIDWQIENLGDVKGVDRLNSSLVFLGETSAGTSIVSFVNATSGDIIERIKLDYYASDIRVKDGNIYLNNGLVLDGSTAFPKSDHSSLFESQERSAFSSTIEDSNLHIAYAERNLIVDIPSTFKQIEYFGWESDKETTELIVSTIENEYHYSRFEDGVLTNHWKRSEDSFDIVAYTTIDQNSNYLDHVKNELLYEQQLNAIEAYKFHVQKSWESLKLYLIGKRFNVGKMLADLITDYDSETLSGLNMRFGFAKQLVVASRSGLVKSFDVLSGSELWSVNSNLEGILKLQLKNETNLLVITSSSIYSIDFTESSPLLKMVDEAPTGYRFNANNDSPTINLVSENDGIFKPYEALNLEHTTPYFVHYEPQTITGFTLENKEFQPTYERKLNTNEYFANHAIREESHVSSLGTILGNRTVLYKYLNPNVGGHLIANSEENSLLLEIFDTVTGESLYSAKHEESVDLSSPINIVIGEYWCVYSYLSMKPLPEQKLVVVELYESLLPDERKSTPGSFVDSLHDNLRPDAITKSYYYPQIINSLALSKTKFGITSKAILLQLNDGSITYLPKYIVNARRKPESEITKEDKEEFMASPYEPTIPINDFFVVNHIRQLHLSNNSRLISISTNLESTTIVCSIGHDIFCTRISPSSQFDKLGASFEKTKVLLTIAALFMLCYILRPMVDQRKLKVKWLVKELDITSI
ncbi:unnamed protein product [Kluyveromyces dobzhanskii CBS 2104]|uniref:ER membrane protein complex subunit 1 n=1 Tax=Kluyveromyces dobzhanskii CBS 2104 TaxID=1427455 RepID=A0A0A8L3K5_9SACH|nr:unnamed protein product [Kluyveromyces dobzhanskii CBS 2104]